MAMRHTKTRLMRKFEERRGEPVETIIRRLHDQGLTKAEIAKTLEISRTTLELWMAHLGASYSLVFRTDETEQPVGSP